TSEVVVGTAMRPSLELAVVALPEASMTPVAVRILKQLKPDLSIVARVHHGSYIPRLRSAGADEVVHAEFEAAAAIIRHVLTLLEVPEPEVERYLEAIREERYRDE